MQRGGVKEMQCGGRYGPGQDAQHTVRQEKGVEDSKVRHEAV